MTAQPLLSSSPAMAAQSKLGEVARRRGGLGLGVARGGAGGKGHGVNLAIGCGGNLPRANPTRDPILVRATCLPLPSVSPCQ